MVNVVRVRLGDEVFVFDGSGREARARLTGDRRREATLEILSVATVDRDPAQKLTLACALPRATRMDWLVEKCSELGVARLIPMVTQRSVVDPIPRQKNRLDRWRRTIVSAAKQSGRTRLTELTDVLPYGAVFEQIDPEAACMVASTEPGAISLSEFGAQSVSGQAIFALVGPEGGFTPEEVDLARKAGCHPVSMGPRVLRVETAAVALAAFLLLGE